MSKTKKDSKDSKAMRKYTPHKPKMTPYKRESKAQRFREDSQLPAVTSAQVYNS